MINEILSQRQVLLLFQDHFHITGKRCPIDVPIAEEFSLLGKLENILEVFNQETKKVSLLITCIPNEILA